MQNDKQIFVTIADQYGRDVIRPACKDARIFADMLGQKTLTTRDVAHIKALGYAVLVKPARELEAL